MVQPPDASGGFVRPCTVTDDMFHKLKDAGQIAELDLSDSTVTNAQLALIVVTNAARGWCKPQSSSARGD